MSTVKIIVDSSSELSPELAHKYDIDIIPIEVTLDGQNYLREWLDITPAEFYKELREKNLFPKTSQPSTQAYIDAYIKASDGGNREVLMISITKKFSGSYNGSLVALEAFKEQFPNAMEVRCLDSRLCTWGLGEMAIACAEMAAEGASMDDILKTAEVLIESVRIYCTCDSLEFLQKGGRVGKAGALAAGLLQIKPMMNFYDGELNPIAKARGRKKSIADQAKYVAADLKGKTDKYIVTPMYGDVLDEAREMAKLYAGEVGLAATPEPKQIGMVIGSHIGPTVLALGYILDWRKLG